MIDEYYTWIIFGYHSYELKPSSSKRVVVVCERCGKYRDSIKYAYRELCPSCALTGKKKPPFTEEHRNNLSESAKNRPTATDEARQNMSEAGKKRKRPPMTDEWRANISKANEGRKKPPRTEEHRRNLSDVGKRRSPVTDEARQHMSAGQQGIPYEEWTGFYSRGDYCEKFDEACRERIREKYNRLCYVCDKNEEDNGQKLSVHHVDMNKNQGCDGVLWKLVPLCRKCHSTTIGEPLQSRIKYILSADTERVE